MNLLENSKIVFAFFILLGFIFPGFAQYLKFLLVPMVILMMTLSIKGVHLGHITKQNYKIVIKLMLINYFVYSPILIALSYIFINDIQYRIGFILLASVPPAASIIPLAYIYHGDIKDSILSEIASYAFALIYSPILVFIFLGENISVIHFIKILFLIILLPMVLARILHRVNLGILEKKNIVINLVYGLSFYIFIGLNHKIFTTDYISLIPVASIVILVTFGLGSLIFFILKKKKVKHAQDILYVLFGTFKNGNSAATLAIILFSPAAAIPVAVRGLLTPFYFVYLENMFKAHKTSVNRKPT